MAVSADLIYVLSASVCASVAAVTDLQSRRIPNWLTVSGMLLGLGLHLSLGGPRDAGLALLAGLLAGGIFFLLFVAGGMGAGDVKLMAAVGCLCGLPSIRSILITTVLLGALAAIVAATTRGRLRETFANACTLFAHHHAHGLATHPDLNVRNPSALRLPYAIPIAGGCAVTLIMHLHGVAL